MPHRAPTASQCGLQESVLALLILEFYRYWENPCFFNAPEADSFGALSMHSYHFGAHWPDFQSTAPALLSLSGFPVYQSLLALPLSYQSRSTQESLSCPLLSAAPQPLTENSWCVNTSTPSPPSGATLRHLLNMKAQSTLASPSFRCLQRFYRIDEQPPPLAAFVSWCHFLPPSPVFPVIISKIN